MSTCAACKEKISRELNDGVNCGECKQLYHPKCVGFSSTELEWYKSQPPAQKLNWRCPECDKKRKNFLRHGSTSDSSMDLTKEIREMRTETSREIREVREELSKQGEKFGSAMDKLEFIIEKFNTMWSEREDLKRDVADLKSQASEIYGMEDLKEVEISNLPMVKEEEKCDFAIEVLNSSLNASITIMDIDNCTVMRTKGTNVDVDGSQSGSALRYSLIVKFMAGRVRDDVMRRWRARRGKGGVSCIINGSSRNIFMRERLTKRLKNLFDRTREAAKVEGWRFVWVRRGSIYVRPKEGEKATKIQFSSDINQIISTKSSKQKSIQA